MKRVGLVTCARLPEPDADQDLLIDALHRAGVDAELLPWDDPAADPSLFSLCVLRSCWNYHLAPAAFRSWLDRAGAATRLLNSAAVVRDNLDKRYLSALAARGVPIVPTCWFEQGVRADLAATARELGWEVVVVKPTVSAASYRTRRFDLRADGGREAQSFLDDLLAERDAMMQLYLRSVETAGERALVWIDGAWTHGVRKEPRFADGTESVSPARTLSEAEASLAEASLAAWRGKRDGLLYARADVVEDDAGRLLLSELELIEPSLFLWQHPPALQRLVRAIARRVAG